MAPKSDPEHARVLEQIRGTEQTHVLDWIEKLEQPARERLFDQLARIDFERLEIFDELIANPPGPPSLERVEPAPVIRCPEDGEAEGREREIISAGEQALREDRVATLVVAGGQGTRLGYDGPKGCYPIMPLSQKSLFGVLAAKIAVARRRYDCQMPWLVMTSPTNDEATRKFFARQNWFGLGRDSVHFFSQNVNPILSPEGKLLRAEKDRLLVGPDGHGGVFGALCDSGTVDKMIAGGHDLISYFQVDNPLVNVADPRFLGHHINLKAEFSCKVIPKRDPEEGLGVAVLRHGQPAIVEYIDLPDEMAEARDENGKLRYRFGSIAIHIINTEFARAMGRDDDSLPWHVARKNYEHLNSSGRKKPGECYKFERFVFDALPHTRACAFVETRREREFAPVKNAHGEDSPRTCRELLKQEWLRWLQEAGARTEPLENVDDRLEIDPRFADGPEMLAGKLPEGFEPSVPLLLPPK